MKIIVTNQAEWDALPKAFAEFTIVEIRSKEQITIQTTPESSSVEAWEFSRVVARGSSSVVARESSSVVAWGSSRVVARESSSVVAWESSSVVARGSSSVVARGSSSVVAGGSSSVVAGGSSSVVARESSRVVARESSRVVAWDAVSVHIHGECIILLFGYAVAWLHSKAKSLTKSKTATVIEPKKSKNLLQWMALNGIEDSDKIILFKRVSHKFQTQENTANETQWDVEMIVEHAAWNPSQEECGQGKFHACSRPFFCDEFRNIAEDKYIAIEVAREDLFAWDEPEYEHKIAFRKGTVLYECDRFGIQTVK